MPIWAFFAYMSIYAYIDIYACIGTMPIGIGDMPK